MLTEIAKLPQNWTLTPLTGKRPYRKGWQSEPPVSRKIIESELKSKATGVGIRLGDISGGLLAIDFDGESANQIWNQLRSNHPEPTTCEWTSGKPGRKQMLLQIAPEHRELLKDFNRAQIPAAQGEQLEFRYNGSQSVLPPSIHPDTQKPYIWLRPPSSGIAIAPEWVINSIIQTKSIGGKEMMNYARFCESITLPVDQTIPLEELIRNVEKELLRTGAPDGSRNIDGIALAKNLSALETYLTSIGQSYEGRAEELIREYAGRCNPPLSEKEITALIEQGAKSNSPTLSEEAIANCIKAYLWRNRSLGSGKNYSQTKKRKVVPLPTPKTTGVTLEDAVNELAKLCDRNAAPAEVSQRIIELSNLCGVSTKDLRQIYEEKVAEKEIEELVLFNELSSIIAAPEKDLDLNEIINKELAVAMYDLALAMPCAPEAILTAALPCWSAAIGTKIRLIIKASARYIQPAILRTCIIAKSGEMKSPIISAVLEAINDLEKQYYNQFKKQQEEYEEQIARWENLPKGEKANEPKPKPPKQKRILVKDVNIDKLIEIHSENPEGLLNVVDELAGYFKRMNKFTGGVGDDCERDLSLFNGGSIIKDRIAYQLQIHRSGVSVVGGIQWEMFLKLMLKNGEADPAGTLCRWLICAKRQPKPYLDFDDETPNTLTELQKELFDYLRALPETDCTLSPEAKTIFKKWQNKIVDLASTETLEPFAIAMAKFQTYCFRLALVLHCVESFWEDSFTTSVSGETARRAIILTMWFMGQYRYVLARLAPQEKFNGEVLQILELLERKGYATTYSVKRFSRNLRKLDNATIKTQFQLLVDNQLAVWSKQNKRGIRIDYLPKNKSNPPTNPPTPENITPSTFHAQNQIESTHESTHPQSQSQQGIDPQNEIESTHNQPTLNPSPRKGLDPYSTQNEPPPPSSENTISTNELPNTPDSQNIYMGDSHFGLIKASNPDTASNSNQPTPGLIGRIKSENPDTASNSTNAESTHPLGGLNLDPRINKIKEQFLGWYKGAQTIAGIDLKEHTKKYIWKAHKELGNDGTITLCTEIYKSLCKVDEIGAVYFVEAADEIFSAKSSENSEK